TTLKMRWAVPVGPHPSSLAYGFNAVWVVDSGDQQLRELDPGDGHLLAQVNTSLDPIAVAILDRVWVLAAGNATADGYDPHSPVQDRSGLEFIQATSMDVGFDAVWVAAAGSVRRLSSGGGDATDFEVGGQSLLVAAGRDVIWVASAEGELRAMDPATGQVLA